MLPGEWGGMGDGGFGWLGVPERTLRYQIANMAYALASVQVNVTPAYREIYHDTIAALLKRLLEPDCWKEWGERQPRRLRPGSDTDRAEAWRVRPAETL
jgi:Linalool dehydratase/isomerase